MSPHGRTGRLTSGARVTLRIAVAGTVGWLAGPLRVRQLHLGKPRPSLLTLAVKGPMYVARSAGLLESAWASVDPRTAQPEDRCSTKS